MSSSLREAIANNRPLIVPSMYDGISALLVREYGFQAAYIGSYGTGATRYGLPDTGYIGAEDMADQVRRLAPIVEVPVIVDGEGGWGNPLHVARSVQLLERAGAAATHIEDHEFGKHIVRTPRIIPVGAAVDKIKAALDGRDSDRFMIIARTDSPGTEGPERAVDRALEYQAAGADALFIAGVLDAPAYTRLIAEATVPLFGVDFPGQSADDLAASQGADVILYYGISHLVAKTALANAYATLANERSTVSLEKSLGGIPGIIGFDDFLGIESVREKARSYGLIDE